MEQLDLTTDELKEIGFKRFSNIMDSENPEREVYRIETLNGYLEIWQKNESKPFELNDVIEESNEWLKSNGR